MTHFQPHALMADCRRIFLRNFKINVNIGVHDYEKVQAQPVVFNIDLYVPLAQTTPQQDKIHEVVDYDFLRETVRQRVEMGHINLQETLCDDIAQSLLKHPLARAVRVSTEKPNVYIDCDAVGIEVFHIKQSN